MGSSQAQIEHTAEAEIAYYKAGFAEAIWIMEGVLKNKLHKDSQVDRIARQTVESILTTLRKASKEIGHSAKMDVTGGLGVSCREILRDTALSKFQWQRISTPSGREDFWETIDGRGRVEPRVRSTYMDWVGILDGEVVCSAQSEERAMSEVTSIMLDKSALQQYPGRPIGAATGTSEKPQPIIPVTAEISGGAAA